MLLWKDNKFVRKIRNLNMYVLVVVDFNIFWDDKEVEENKN